MVMRKPGAGAESPKKQTNILTKRLFGRHSGAPASTAINTVSGAIELECAVLRYRIGYISVAGTVQPGLKSCTGWLASVAGRANYQGPITPTAGWTANTYAGAATFDAPVRLGTERPSITWCDWVDVPSLARTDGGVRPILLYRYEFPIGTIISYPTNGTAHWRDSGKAPRLLTTNVQAVGGVTSTAAFTQGNSAESVTNICIPVVQYVSQSAGMQVMIGGDSIAEGVGAIPACYGYVQRACYELSTPERPIEYFNAALHSQQPPIYAPSVEDWAAVVKPTFAFYQPYSVNQVTNTPAGSGLNANDLTRIAFGAGTAFAALDAVETWLLPPMPVNTAFKNIGAGDQRRRDYYTSDMPAFHGHKTVTGPLEAYTGERAASGQDQIKVGLSGDNAHPNQAGSIALAPGVKAVLSRSRPQP